MHILSLYIPKPEDSNVLVIRDISVYDPDLTITNPQLKLRVPGINNDIFVNFEPNNTNYYTSGDLFITPIGMDIQSLPDGIYEYTYSVCPNEDVFIRGRFLRCYQTRLFLVCAYSKNILMRDSPGCLPKTEVNIKLIEDLLLILESAESDARCNKINEASSKLDYISNKINTL
jgi:hypothetical protein